MSARKQMIAKLEEIDERYLAVVERMVRSLVSPTVSEGSDESWDDFVATTFGSLSEAPIERGEQGQPEIRDSLR